MTTLARYGFSERGTKDFIEEGDRLSPKFDADGLIPAICTDAETGEVMMFAWMNADALAATLDTGEAHYWSRSRAEMWRKGGTSGNTQKVVEVRVDCDQDVVLLRVEPAGPACHVGYRSCFYRAVDLGPAPENGRRMRLVEAEKTYDPDVAYGRKPKKGDGT